jgi:hypothetical protein
MLRRLPWISRWAERGDLWATKTGYIFRTKSSGALAAISANSKGMPFALSETPSLKILGAVIPRRVFTQPGPISESPAGGRGGGFLG